METLRKRSKPEQGITQTDQEIEKQNRRYGHGVVNAVVHEISKVGETYNEIRAGSDNVKGKNHEHGQQRQGQVQHEHKLVKGKDIEMER